MFFYDVRSELFPIRRQNFLKQYGVMIMLVFVYESKKDLKQNIGERLYYQETSLFDPEYTDNGVLYGSNRPHITGHKREFFASVTMKDGKIQSVK